jgi:hypothetical protein
MLPGAAVFYGSEFNPGGIFWMWAGFAVLMGAPWALLCSPSPRRLTWAIPTCFVLTSIPPIALAGVANPLMSAGVLMPRMGWFGLIATIGLATFMALRPRYGVLAWSVLFGIACLTYRPVPSHSNWQGIDTQFGGAGINLADPLSEYRNTSSAPPSLRKRTLSSSLRRPCIVGTARPIFFGVHSSGSCRSEERRSSSERMFQSLGGPPTTTSSSFVAMQQRANSSSAFRCQWPCGSPEHPTAFL